MISDHVEDHPVAAIRSRIAAMWLGLIVFIAILYVILRVVVLRSFADLERVHTLDDVDRAVNAIEEQTRDLNAKASDWAAWDDAYRFVQDGNSAFIRSNFVLSAFTGIGLNLIAYIRPSGEVVYARWYEPGTHRLVPVPEGVRRAVYRDSLLIRHRDIRGSVSGITMIDRGPMLVASRPVVTSREQGPIRGALIFGQLLDSEEVQRLSRITRVSLTIARLDDGPLPPDLAQALSQIREGRQKVVKPLNRRIVAGYTTLDTIRGRPVLMLRVEVPRTFYNRGLALSNYALASLVILSILFGTVLSLLLVRTVQREREYDLKTREFYRRTIQAATEGKLVITDRDEICRIAGEPIATWVLIRPEEVSTIRHEIEQLARESGMEQKERVDYFVLVAGEALTNAFKHAGGGRATMHRLSDGLMFVVADRGAGMPSLALPDVALTRGYSTAGTLGMGYKFMISITDRVYLSTGPFGTTVGLVMGFRPEQMPSLGIPALGTMLAQQQGKHSA